MTVTVACVLVHGHVKFTLEYVRRLQSMVAKNMDRPYRFVCLTDQPESMPAAVEAIPIVHPQNFKGWWAKINLFRPGLFTGRVLYLDLDVLIVAPLAPIIDYPARMALVPDGAPNFEGQGELRTVHRYNSSVMVWDAGVPDDLFKSWTPAVAERLWGDQDFIGEQMPSEMTMPAEWFPRISAVQPPWPADTKVVLVKKPKNHLAANRWPWFERAWG